MSPTVSNLLTLFVACQIVQAITINTPAGWKGNQTNKVTWTTNPGDPTVFSVELVNDQFNEKFALANNVPASQGTLSLPLPQINHVGDDVPFTLQFVNISDANQVYATSPSFTIEEQDDNGSASSSAGSVAFTSRGSSGSPTATGTSQLTTQTSPGTAAGGSTTRPASGTVSQSSTPVSETAPASSSPGAANRKAEAFGTMWTVLAVLVGMTGL